jgi:hypothetical protein
MDTAMKCVSIVAATLLATNALAQVIDEPASSNIAAATGEPEPLLPEKCELLEIVNGRQVVEGRLHLAACGGRADRPKEKTPKKGFRKLLGCA